MPSAYDQLGELYDAWCRSVTEDVAHYVELAVESGGPVLEIGVGSGRIAVPTAVAGIRVTGVDTSPAMLDLARDLAKRRRVAPTLVLADMRHLPGLGEFPLITAPFRVFLHLRDDDERCAVLCSLRKRLAPAGRLAFDLFHPDPADMEETHRRWLEREPGIRERATWRPAERSLTLEVQSGERRAAMELWWAEPSDWRRLLAAAGFTRVESYGWFDRRALTADSPDSVWIAAAE